jgi:hypothetical protein
MILSLISHRYILRNDTICFFSDLVGALYCCNGQRACEDKQKRRYHLQARKGPENVWKKEETPKCQAKRTTKKERG